jgi:c-di-GMP-binding flagellar brake protein YcgR
VDWRERRAFLRVETEVDVTASLLAEDGTRGEPFDGITADLSAGGLRLRTRTALRDGDVLWLELTVEQPRILVFSRATVVRVEPTAYGVRFDDLDEYVEQRLVRWVYGQDRRLADRQAQARIPVRVRAVIRPQGEGRREFAAPTVDISADGIWIASDRALQMGEVVDVALELEASGEPFESPATVEGLEDGVQGHRFGYWLQFQGLTFVRQRELVERAIGVEHDQKQPPG